MPAFRLCRLNAASWRLHNRLVSNTILDWAQQREMGFSYFIALGDGLDIDVDELLDYLARDGENQRHPALSRTVKRRATLCFGGP
ncbi:hypothetical protein ACLK19_17250 [Escherichia coli]